MVTSMITHNIHTHQLTLFTTVNPETEAPASIGTAASDPVVFDAWCIFHTWLVLVNPRCSGLTATRHSMNSAQMFRNHSLMLHF